MVIYSPFELVSMELGFCTTATHRLNDKARSAKARFH